MEQHKNLYLKTNFHVYIYIYLYTVYIHAYIRKNIHIHIHIYTYLETLCIYIHIVNVNIKAHIYQKYIHSRFLTHLLVPSSYLSSISGANPVPTAAPDTLGWSMARSRPPRRARPCLGRMKQMHICQTSL